MHPETAALRTPLPRHEVSALQTVPALRRTMRRSRGSYGSRPSTRTRPSVTGPAPSSACSSVVFPAPLGPSSTTCSPAATGEMDVEQGGRGRAGVLHGEPVHLHAAHRSSPSRAASRRTSS